MYKQDIISAIQNQKMLEVQFQKETDRDWVTRELAPYDIYEKKRKDGNHKTVLLGYCWQHKDYKAAPILIYLDTINKISVLDISFNGQKIIRLINPKETPKIPRDW